MSADTATQQHDFISKYIAENARFTDPKGCDLGKPLRVILDKFNEALPDIKFMRIDYDDEQTIMIYTNYNFKVCIDASVNDYGHVIPKHHKDGKCLVWIVPFDDAHVFFPNEEYYHKNGLPAELYVNDAGYLMIHRPEKYDIPFDISQCDYKKGILPCVFIAALCSDDDKDELANKLFAHLIGKL